MNIMHRVTTRHLKVNGKRTMVTILGVIVSVALITAILSGMSSLQDCLYQNAVIRQGRWHVLCKDVPLKEKDAFEKEDYVDKAMLVKPLGYSPLKESQNIDKPYLFVSALSKEACEGELLHLTEGRFPENDSELLVSKHVMENGGVDVKIGDVLDLELGRRMQVEGNLNDSATNEEGTEDSPLQEGNEELGQEFAYTHEGEKWESYGDKKGYTVVGVVNRPCYAMEGVTAPGYSVFTLMEREGEASSAEEKADVYVHLSKITQASVGKVSDLYKAMGGSIENVIENSSLLMYQGATKYENINQTFFLLVVILLIISMVGSISLIYNAFAISVSEKYRQLGMLSSVGATRKQKRSTVYFEGFVIGIIGIPVGIVVGLLGLGTTFMLIKPLTNRLLALNVELQLAVSFEVFPIILLFSALTIWLSMYIPAKRASKISPMEAVRQTKDVKITRRSVRVGRLLTFLYGFAGTVAMKNLKRNKKRYRATVFSLFICIVLFLTVQGYGYYLKKAFLFEKGQVNYDALINIHDEEVNENVGNGEGNSVGKLKLASNQWMERLNDLKGKEGLEQVNYIKSIDGFRAIDGLDFVTDEVIANTYQLYQLSTNEGIAAIEDLPSVQDMKSELKENGGWIHVGLVALDDESMRKYVKDCGINPDEFFDSKQLKGIIWNSFRYRDDDSSNYKIHEKQQTRLKKGDSISIALGSEEYSKTEQESSGAWTEQYRTDLAIMGEAKECPTGIQIGESTGSNLMVFISEESLLKMENQLDEVNQKLSEETNGDRLSSAYKRLQYTFVFENEQKAEKILEDYEDTIKEPHDLVNVFQSRRQEQDLLTFLSIFAYGFICLVVFICIANIFNTITTSFLLRRKEFAMLRSVGMTNKEFRRMVAYESLFYGTRALAFGLPISVAILIWVFRSINLSIGMSFSFPWMGIVIVVVSVFVVVGSSMAYSLRKIKGENLIDALKLDIM